MSLEVLLEKLTRDVLATKVSRRELPPVLYGAAAVGNSLTELEAKDFKIIDFRVEFNEVILPKFRVNIDRIVRLLPTAENIDGILRNSFLLLRFAQEKFDVPWYCGFFQWGCESTFSQDKTAFERNRQVWGAMQRTVSLYPNTQVEEALSGYEFVQGLGKWEHPSDPGELFWGFSKLDADARVTKNADQKTRIWTIIDAVGRYSEDGPRRQAVVDLLNRIFG